MIFSEVDNDKEYINNSMAIGTGLFELYLALQSISKYFHNYGKLCSTLFYLHISFLLSTYFFAGLVANYFLVKKLLESCLRYKCEMFDNLNVNMVGKSSRAHFLFMTFDPARHGVSKIQKREGWAWSLVTQSWLTCSLSCNIGCFWATICFCFSTVSGHQYIWLPTI